MRLAVDARALCLKLADARPLCVLYYEPLPDVPLSAVLIIVTQRASGFVATCQLPLVLALGASAVIAAENALLAVRIMVSKANLPATLIVRTEMPDCSMVVMQAIDEPICVDRGRTEPRTRPRAAI